MNKDKNKTMNKIKKRINLIYSVNKDNKTCKDLNLH